VSQSDEIVPASREFKREECLSALEFWLKHYAMAISRAYPSVAPEEVKSTVEGCALNTCDGLWQVDSKWSYEER
jgi:hypothetical protein